MNAERKSKGTNKSWFARNKLFGIIWNVHDSSSSNSKTAHLIEPNPCDKDARKLAETAKLKVDLQKAEAYKLGNTIGHS